MIKKLVKHGRSYAIIIDDSIMELLQITPKTPLELKVDHDVLIVTPIRTDYSKSAEQPTSL